MKRIYNIISRYIVGAGVVILASCKTGGDVNVSPNQSPNVQSGYLLTSSLQFLGGTGGSGATTNINSYAGELYSQYLSETF
ncbi:hypothetical protein ABID99_000447 [Mucilaginibacter sp. OAE612]|uniref:hypothetical protein n=1 Tax=Mucilaginibacter sp. OAE612 TaxID=3156444 RepID=UPI00359CFAF2